MSRAVPLLSLVFFFSGMSSLIYQIVWQRLLTVHYGVGAVSITLIVTVYMLGLGLGAVLGGLIAVRVHRRLAAYLLIELALGAFGLASLDLLGWIGSHTAGSDYPVALWFMFLFLCVPTMLMGMTLPLVVQIMTGLLHDFRRSVSFLYFINTLGAASGALIASYGLISFFGLDIAVFFAAAVTFFVAGLILFAAHYADSSTASGISIAESPEETETLGRLAFLTVFVT
jgi:predicted membrane-bound spermidine synthase